MPGAPAKHASRLGCLHALSAHGSLDFLQRIQTLPLPSFTRCWPHACMQGFQAGGLLGTVVVFPVRALLTKSLTLPKAVHTAGLASLAGVTLSGALLANKMQSIKDREGYEDRVYRLVRLIFLTYTNLFTHPPSTHLHPSLPSCCASTIMQGRTVWMSSRAMGPSWDFSATLP